MPPQTWLTPDEYGSTLGDHDSTVPANWFRRAHWAVYFFFGLLALSGLGYVYYEAIEGEVVGAMIGLGIVFGSIGLGVAMHCVVRMAAVVDANLNTITLLRHRHDALQHFVERLSRTIELNQKEVAQVSSLVAAETTADSYPRLAEEEGKQDGVVDAPVGDVPIGNRTSSDALPDGAACAAATVNAVAVQHEAGGNGADNLPTGQTELREAFRRAIYAQDFAGAITVGERILDLHPESPMAEQYNELYESIACRVGEGDIVASTST